MKRGLSGLDFGIDKRPYPPARSLSKSKQGLSPVIATALLIMLVLVLGSIIFLWARGFISEQVEKFGQPIESVCKNADFDVEFVKSAGGSGVLDIVNRGNVNIYDFEIKQVKGGDSETSDFNIGADAGEAVPSQPVSFGSDVDKIVISPKVLGNVKGKKLNKPVTCFEQGKTINL